MSTAGGTERLRTLSEAQTLRICELTWRQEMDTTCDLGSRKCKPCEGGVAALDATAAREYLSSLDGWELAGAAIEKTYRFRNFHETMAFVNALAWVSHREDHHPDLAVGYAECRVRYQTHAIGGLSENDFICAAKVDSLFPL
ncbi:MAG: 4a-hydroxytetrahydrobiopterin dehydratase [Azonexus sp.]